jgi:hypothetical protein
MSNSSSGLHVVIDNYPVDINKDTNGNVSITVHAGIFGNQTITIPPAEWAKIVAYTSTGVSG